jgi:hypothetical protein
MIVFAKLVLFLLFALITVVPSMLFLLHQPGRRYNKSGTWFERFQAGMTEGIKEKSTPSPSEGLISRALLMLLCIWVFSVERNVGYLLLAAVPLLAQVRKSLRLPQGLAGDEREFTMGIRITAASFTGAFLLPLTISILWSGQVDALTLLAVMFTGFEILHLVLSWQFNRVETLETEPIS